MGDLGLSSGVPGRQGEEYELRVLYPSERRRRAIA